MGFQILESGFLSLLDSGFQFLVESGFLELFSRFRIPQAKIPLIPESGFLHRATCTLDAAINVLKFMPFKDVIYKRLIVAVVS